jgi:class 3 adenylate cyclase
MADTSRAVLLVADISGFTQFLRLHAISSVHAREIIVRLLNVLVRASRAPLRVAELEGDAVFFYALAERDDLAAVSARVKDQIPRLFRAFRREIEAMRHVPLCVCDACMSVGNLRLKQVVHTGEVALERIDRFQKLFGLDVVVVHRMLKNTVPAKEYLMLSDPAYASFMGFYDQEPERRKEQLEGVGELDMLVFYESHLTSVLAQVDEDAEESRPSGRLRILGWKLGLAGRTVSGLLRRRATADPA